MAQPSEVPKQLRNLTYNDVVEKLPAGAARNWAPQFFACNYLLAWTLIARAGTNTAIISLGGWPSEKEILKRICLKKRKFCKRKF